jgi:hypothetical protein
MWVAQLHRRCLPGHRVSRALPLSCLGPREFFRGCPEFFRCLQPGLAKSSINRDRYRLFSGACLCRRAYATRWGRLVLLGGVDLMLGEIRHAVRSLRRWRLGAAMAVATLTIAIGTATGLYAFLRASLASQTREIEDIDDVARIYASNRSLGVERAPLALIDFQSALVSASSFESIAACQSDEREIAVDGMTSTISVGQVTDLFFQVFRARPALGRLISAQDASRREPVMVVSDSIWRKYFAGRTAGDHERGTMDRGRCHAAGISVLVPRYQCGCVDVDANRGRRVTFGVRHRSVEEGSNVDQCRC